MTRILQYRDNNDDEGSVSTLQLAAHASDFVLAGSETTATALATTTYYLLKSPTAWKKLSNEIRSAFTTYEEIDHISTQPLSYLEASINEGMRMYTPLPFSLPRLVPQGGGIVDGNFLFQEVRTIDNRFEP